MSAKAKGFAFVNISLILFNITRFQHDGVQMTMFGMYSLLRLLQIATSLDHYLATHGQFVISFYKSTG